MVESKEPRDGEGRTSNVGVELRMAAAQHARQMRTLPAAHSVQGRFVAPGFLNGMGNPEEAFLKFRLSGWDSRSQGD